MVAPAVWSGPVPLSWPAQFDIEDYQDQSEDAPVFRSEVESPSFQRLPKQLETQDFMPEEDEPRYASSAQQDTESRDYSGKSSSSGAGYYNYAPKSIVLNDDNSYEARFPFPAFPS